MEQVARLSQCVDAYSQSDWMEYEKVIQDHKAAMLCQDAQSNTRFLIFMFNEVYQLAATYPSSEGVSQSDFEPFRRLISRLHNLFHSLVRVAPNCERLGHPLDDLGKIQLRLEEITLFSENLEACSSENDRRECLEDFVDLVDSDAVTSDPNSESIPWKRTTDRAA